jgi:hypothetical protein
VRFFQTFPHESIAFCSAETALKPISCRIHIRSLSVSKKAATRFCRLHRNLLPACTFNTGMRAPFSAGLVLTATLACAQAPAQSSANASSASPTATAPGDPSLSIDINWTPPIFAQLSAEASTRSSFSLDRTSLSVAAGLIPQTETDARQAIGKLDGVSGHILSFPAAVGPDEALVAALRQAYHQRGWKHLVTNTNSSTANPNAKGPLANSTTDVWVVMDGSNLRGAVALVESQRNVTLVTISGNLSAVDLLHLRGHFGIPRYDPNQLTTQR